MAAQQATSKGLSVVETPYPFNYLFQFALDCKDVIAHFWLHHKLKRNLQKLLETINANMLVLPAVQHWGTISASFKTLIVADPALKLMVNHKKSVNGPKNMH